MKKIINGKMYNTETAKLLCEACGRRGSASWWKEQLYRKKTGEYFLFGEGGPGSRWAVPLDINSWNEGEDVIPMTEEEARAWAEKNADVEEYCEIFGEPEE